jgi:hypothetical protein
MISGDAPGRDSWRRLLTLRLAARLASLVRPEQRPPAPPADADPRPEPPPRPSG